MNIAANILLGLMVFSGFYLLVSQSWTGFYKGAILFHPAFGVPATLVLLVHYIMHARSRTGDAPAGKGFGTAFFIVAVLAAGVLSAFSPMVFMPLACVGAAAAFFFTTRKILRVSMPGHFRPAAAGWQIVFFLIIVCMFNGLALLPMDGLARPKILFTFHRYVAYITLGAFVFCVLLPFYTRLRLGGRALSEYARAAAPAAVICALFAFGTYFFAQAEKKAAKDPVYSAAMSTIPIEKRAPEDSIQGPIAPDVANMVQMSDSCASNRGCHQQELYDFRLSNHNLSVRTPYFQKNLGMLVDEIGAENLKICAGCHYPYMLLSGDLDYKYYLKNDGFSCVFCHQIGQVRHHPADKRITYLTIEPNVAHLRMFYRPGSRDQKISRLDDLLVKLHAPGHGRVFTRPLYFKDDYCQVCHALQIKTPGFTGLQQNSCIRCHMQPRSFLGLKGKKKKNHFFPGTNTAVPYTLGDWNTVSLVSDWVRGYITADVKTVNFWKLRKKTGERSARAFWLFLNLDPINRPMPGEPFEFDIITTNVGIDHQFPSAPLDLVEAWLQVTVKDASGRVIYDLGALDKSHRLAKDYPEKHRLGGYMIDSKNHLVVKNRVWDIKKKFVLRNIMPGATTKDRLEFTIPGDARGPLSITAKWNYRKLNQDFADWGFTDIPVLKDKPKTTPVTIVGELETTMPVQGKKQSPGPAKR